MDIKYIKELISLLEKSGVQRITIKEKNGVEISIDKGAPVQMVQETQMTMSRPSHQIIPPAPQVQAFVEAVSSENKESDELGSEVDHNKCIKSPMVGTFYASESPDSLAIVKVGSLINKGDTLCIIEAMKVMNEIKSDRQGKVTQVLVENGSPIEYGQALFVVE